MFKPCGLKPPALSEVFSSLVSAALETERERGDVGIYFYLSVFIQNVNLSAKYASSSAMAILSCSMESRNLTVTH